MTARKKQRSGLIYDIRTLDDFKNVPPNRLAACLREFRMAVLLHRNMETLINAVGAEKARQGDGEWPASGVAFKPLVFRWTDDDEGKMDIHVKLGSASPVVSPPEPNQPT